MHTEEVRVRCPYCGEKYSMVVDPSEGDVQRFVSDCEVCCRPIEFQLRVGGEGEPVELEARRDSSEHY